MLCVVTMRPGEQGRAYRLPSERDATAGRKAGEELERQKKVSAEPLSLVPDEPISHAGTFRIIKMLIYGARTWGDLFTGRQALALVELGRSVASSMRQPSSSPATGRFDPECASAIRTCLALVLDRQADTLTSISRWNSAGEKIEGIFSRQAIPILWDFAEANPFSGATGGLEGAIDWVSEVIEANRCISVAGQTSFGSATSVALPDDSAHAVVTDPPYYDSIAYAALSDFFYVWLRRTVGPDHYQLLQTSVVERQDEIIVDMPHERNTVNKDVRFYEEKLTEAFGEERRVASP